MARTDTLNHFLTDVADSIREKTHKQDPISASDFDTEIESIEAGAHPEYISFYGYYGNTIDLSWLHTDRMTSFESMFRTTSLTSLDLSNFDTSSVRGARYMFADSNILTSITGMRGFENLEDGYNMFYGLKGIVNLDISGITAGKLTEARGMFTNCNNLETLDMRNFDFGKTENIVGMLTTAPKLTNLTFGKNLGKGYTRQSSNYNNYALYLDSCPLLTHDSLMSVINNLYDLNETYSEIGSGVLYRQRLGLGATNMAKLTEEEIAIATNKGWNVT